MASKREAIWAYVGEHPAATLREIAGAVGLKWPSEVKYHLERLSLTSLSKSDVAALQAENYRLKQDVARLQKRLADIAALSLPPAPAQHIAKGHDLGDIGPGFDSPGGGLDDLKIGEEQ